MLIIDRYDTQDDALHARAALIAAQGLVDLVTQKVVGEPVFPPAEDIYVVVPEGPRFAIALDDPSLPEERDCGD